MEERMKVTPIVQQIGTSNFANNSTLPQQTIQASVHRKAPENIITVQNIQTPVVHIAASPAVQVPATPTLHVPAAAALQIPSFQLVASQTAPPPSISVQIAPSAQIPVAPSVIHVNPAALVQSQV